GGHYRLQTRNVGKEGLGALAVGLAAEDAATCGHANDHGAGELPRRAVADARRLRHDLIIGRIHVIGELDLDARPQAIGRHADGSTDDTGLVDRRVEAARDAVLLLQALRAAENPPEVAYVLSKNDDLLVSS